MNTQLALPIGALAQHADFEDVAALIEWLAGRGWTLARDISACVPAWDDRRLRAIASQSQGRIMSGVKGYKLTIEATPDEVQRAAARLRSQASDMTQRSLDIERVWHNAAKHHQPCATPPIRFTS